MAESAYPKRTWHLTQERIWRKDKHLMYYKCLFYQESEKERKWSWVGGKDLGEAEGGETRVRVFQGLQMAQQNAS